MKNSPLVISGHAFTGDDLALQSVEIVIEMGIITAIEEIPKVPHTWICPAFFNAHTHLGDTIAMDCCPSGDLEEMVTPPHGLKHRMLAAASRKDLILAMRSTIQGMHAGGTAGCADFREGGTSGVSALREAAGELSFLPVIFGRDGGERVADGWGISSTRDTPVTDAKAAEIHRAGKKIAIHAGEKDASDVDEALSLDPDLLIHCTHATKKQLRICADRQIPIAVCPRSNWMLGVSSSARHPPLQLLQDLGCTVLLGTDNVMFVPPDMFSEMAFSSFVYKMDPEFLFHAAVKGSELTGAPFFIQKGERANLFTIDPEKSSLQFSRNPLMSIVKRSSASHISNNIFNL
jgi:cytosine/adenosine deaminase-related metal-dependent hydrolase